MRRLLPIQATARVLTYQGLGLGLVLTLVEALKAIPPSLKFHLTLPSTTIVFSICLNMILGVIIAFLASPFLGLRRGELWHYTSSVGLVAALMCFVPEPMSIPFKINLLASLMIGVFYGVGLLIARWRRWLIAAVAFVALATISSFAVPYSFRPVDWTLSAQGFKAPRDAPNVLLVVLDTLRSDRTELLGHHRETFPWFTTFANEGATFRRAISPAPWTLPSHASIFTGLYPSAHGAHHEHTFLDESRTTIAEIFRKSGWTTVSMSANPWISRSTGMTQGFEIEHPTWAGTASQGFALAYRILASVSSADRDHNGRNVTETWLRWLSQWDGKRPFFAFLNYLEPHFPYHHIPRDHVTTFAPPGATYRDVVRASETVADAAFRGDRAPAEAEERVRELYDSAIRYQNDLVARAVEGLRERALIDDTIIVLVSDHGDLLGEHNGMFTHNRGLTEYLLRVPLLIRYPLKVPRGVFVEESVTTAALLPSILDLADLSPPEGIQTKSFIPILGGDLAAGRSPILSENYKDEGRIVAKDYKPRHVFDRFGVRYRALEDGTWKLVVDSEGQRWLFQPSVDPTESTDLQEDHPEIAEALARQLNDLVEAYGLGALDRDTLDDVPGVEIDPEVRERLRALGYVQ